MNTEEQRAAFLNSQVACALIEMNAMIAENKQRDVEGKSPAYAQKDFISLIEKYPIGHNEALETLWGQR